MCLLHTVLHSCFFQYMFTVGVSGNLRSNRPEHKVPPCQFIRYTTVLEKENKNAREFKNVKVYVADPWHRRANGYITNLKYISE